MTSTSLVLSNKLSLPPETMTLTTAIVGIRGSGKTNSGVVLTEELRKIDQQLVIIDPLDVWWGLTSSADGQAPGVPIVILGGRNGDIPLAATDGKTIADFLAETRASVVLSLAHLKKAEQKRFVADLAEQLYHRKSEAGLNTPLLFVVDEASTFVPQRFSSDMARCVGAIEDLVRRGRAFGFGVMLIDQRPASINKDVLTQLEVLIAHRITSPQDRNALQEWVKAHDTAGHEKQFLDSLASLPRGEAWIWSPNWLNIFERVVIRKRETFDSSATPKLGEIAIAPQVRAPVDLEGLRSRLAETIEKAQADDPAKLREVLDQKRKELAQAHEIVESMAETIGYLERDRDNLALQLSERPAEPVTVEVPVLSEEILEQLGDIVSNLQASARETIEHTQEALGVAAKVQELMAEARKGPTATNVQDIKNGAAKVGERLVVPANTPKPHDGAPSEFVSVGTILDTTNLIPSVERPYDLSAGQNRILDALAEFNALGISSPRREHVAVWSNYTGGSGTYNSQVKELLEKRFICYPASGLMSLTERGQVQAKVPTKLRSLQDLQNGLLKRFNKAQQAMAGALIACYPGSLSRGALAGVSGLTEGSGTFNSYITQLIEAGLIVISKPKHLSATRLCFVEGLE